MKILSILVVTASADPMGIKRMAAIVKSNSWSAGETDLEKDAREMQPFIDEAKKQDDSEAANPTPSLDQYQSPLANLAKEAEFTDVADYANPLKQGSTEQAKAAPMASVDNSATLKQEASFWKKTKKEADLSPLEDGALQVKEGQAALAESRTEMVYQKPAPKEASGFTVHVDPAMVHNMLRAASTRGLDRPPMARN